MHTKIHMHSICRYSLIQHISLIQYICTLSGRRAAPSETAKLNIQLYKTPRNLFVLDIQNVCFLLESNTCIPSLKFSSYIWTIYLFQTYGQTFMFLDICSKILRYLRHLKLVATQSSHGGKPRSVRCDICATMLLVLNDLKRPYAYLKVFNTSFVRECTFTLQSKHLAWYSQFR